MSSAPLKAFPKVEFSNVRVTQVAADDIASLREQILAANKAGAGSFKLQKPAPNKPQPKTRSTHVAEFKTATFEIKF
eukprot:932386-Prorocentrum_minimum.AAC.3